MEVYVDRLQALFQLTAGYKPFMYP